MKRMSRLASAAALLLLSIGVTPGRSVADSPPHGLAFTGVVNANTGLSDITCNSDPDGGTTITKTVTGSTVGQYAGTFTATYTVRFGPQVGPDEIRDFPSGQTTMFHESFTIFKPTGEVWVTGTKDLTPAPGGAPGANQGTCATRTDPTHYYGEYVCSEVVNHPGFILFRQNTFFVFSTFAATIHAADGDYQDSGISATNDTWANLQCVGFNSVSAGFNESFITSNGVVSKDQTPPTITGSASPVANAAGWNNTDATVTFNCADELSGVASCTAPVTVTETSGQTISGSAVDHAGNIASTSVGPIRVDKTPPTVGATTFTTNPLMIGATTTLTTTAADSLSGVAGGEFFVGTDPGTGTATPMTLSGSTLSASLGSTLIPGVYSIGVRSQDRAGNWSATSTGSLVVYNPNGGFVTGGGWITSPAGAYTPDPSLTGRANFGFESRYQKGANAPTGNTEFQLKTGNLNFHSTNYQWLVIAGAKAQYKGNGTINGAGSYDFMLTAIDGHGDGGDGVDKLRVRIWDHANGAIIYDNQNGADDNATPITAVTNGSIVIHK